MSTVGEDKASRRKFSRIFHLKKEGESLPVCKEMFISTLAISQQKVNGAINRDKENTGITLAVVKPRNPRPAKCLKWMDDDITFLDEFFEKVPKVPSHYCRRDTTKTYLYVIFPTLIKLYDVYKARCQAFKKTVFSLSKFSDVFKGKSLSLYKRKKDKCNTCTGHDEGNVSNEAFLAHQKLKDERFALKEKDKCSADSISKFVLTADTESLLQAPLNNSDIMFFKSKLNLHNLKSRKVVNYLWSEVNGEIEPANFTSCYIDYMTALKEQNPMLNTIVVWTDGCNYQNHCNILASGLLTFAVEQNITIYHKYLEVGHTHMECDSVHSAIEKQKQKADVNLPTDYVEIIKKARSKSNYGKYLDFSFFRDYKEVCDIKTLKPSIKVGPPYVQNIRQLCYKPIVPFHLI